MTGMTQRSCRVDREHLARLLDANFPIDTIDHAFAYGSAVFTQPGLYPSGAGPGAGPGTDTAMLDLIFTVSDPVAWHRHNLARNPHHYAFPMALLGAPAINWASEYIGCGVYFNPMVRLETKNGQSLVVKYGVASTESVERDLLDWNALYVAGRLHKAVETLVEDRRIAAAQQTNLSNALRTALCLLMLENTDPDSDRYLNGHRGESRTSRGRYPIGTVIRTIVSLSYTGDIRVGIAEDAKKVERIVEGSWDRLVDMYTPAIAREVERGTLVLPGASGPSGSSGSSGSSGPSGPSGRHAPLAIDHDGLVEIPERDAHQSLLSRSSLPAALRQRIQADGAMTHAALATALAATVRRSSARQAALGLISAGPLRAASYLRDKLSKC